MSANTYRMRWSATVLSEEGQWNEDGKGGAYRLRGLDAVLGDHGFLRGGLGLALALSQIDGGGRRHGDC